MTSHRRTALGLVFLASMGLSVGCADDTGSGNGDQEGPKARPTEIRLRGIRPDDAAGSAVGRAGDVNGDGHADLLVSAPGSGEGSASRVFVLTGPFEADATLDEAAGFTILGETGVDLLGGSEGVGDVNGDGLDDILVNSVAPVPPFDGCYHDCPERPAYEGELRAFVVFGRADGADVSLSDIAAGRGGGFVIEGERAEMGAIELAPLGDLDGDGRADFAIGSPDAGYTASATGWGRVYVVFGRAATTTLDLGAVGTTERGFVVEGDSVVTFARTIAPAGDVNGDGLADLLIGDDVVVDEAGESVFGRVYVVLGKASMDRVTAADLRAGRSGFVIEGESNGGPTPCCASFGLAMAGGGDVDGDGLDDIVVSAPFFETGDALPEGRLYVVHGRTETTPVLAGDVARGVGGFALTGGNGIGYTLPPLEDLDGDGRADILTSDYDGKVLLYPAGSPADAEIVKPKTEGYWYLADGSSVGDLDDDGTGDLVLVAPSYGTGSPGEVVILFR